MTTRSSSLARLVRRYRVARGWTQDELGQRAGVSMRTISDIERGLSRYPHRDTLHLLLTAFDLTGEAARDFQEAARGTGEAAPNSAALPHFPQPTTPLAGRTTDCATAQGTLARHQTRLLTLVGPAGVGKTRLAIEIARMQVAAMPAQADRWFFVDLTQAVTADDVVSETIRQVGISEERERDPLTLLHDWLAERHLWLVLDNFEQAISAASLVAALLVAHPHLVLCVTSRIPLRLAAETVQEVAPLPIPDHRHLTQATLRQEPALLLFEAVAQSVAPTFTLAMTNSPVIARICARLDGLPLGIELVATQVAQHPLTELLRQISRFTGLTAPGFFAPLVAGRPRRQQTLGHAIAWSYDRLDVPVQMLFRRLCIFAGEFDVEAAIGVCDVHGALGIDVVDGIAVLLDHHLIGAVALPATTRSPRFAMLAVIRDFGRDLLAQRGELATIRQQHAHYYADLLRHHEADFVSERQSERLTLFTRDYDNILAALRQAREQRDVLLGLHLVSSLWWYWEKRRTLTEGRDWLSQMLALVETTRQPIDPAILSRAYYGASALANAQGDVAQAQHYGQLCLRWCLVTNDQGRIGQAHTLLGTVATTAGDISTALSEYEQALAVLRQVDSPRQLVPILNNLSALAIEQGDLTRAKALLEESLAVKRRLGDQRGIAVGLINLGEWHKQQGAFALALANIAEAEAIFTDLGDQVGMAMASNNAGEIALAHADPASALVAFGRSLTLFERSESRTGTAMVHCHLGDAHLAVGNRPAAAHAWQASLAAQPTGSYADHCRAALAALAEAAPEQA